MENEIRVSLHFKPQAGRGWATRMKWWRVEAYEDGICILHDDICSVEPETALKRFKAKHRIEDSLLKAA